MAVFKIFLIGSAEPLNVNLPTSDLAELALVASRIRFLAGRSSSESGDGVECGVIIPTARIHLIVQD